MMRQTVALQDPMYIQARNRILFTQAACEFVSFCGLVGLRPLVVEILIHGSVNLWESLKGAQSSEEKSLRNIAERTG